MNNGNQALETLAALCRGASESATQQGHQQANNVAASNLTSKNSNEQPSGVFVSNDAMLSPNLTSQLWLQYLSTLSNASQNPNDAAFRGMATNASAPSAYQPGTPNNLAAALYQMIYNLQGPYQPLVQAAQASQIAGHFGQQQQHLQIAAPSPSIADFHLNSLVNSSSANAAFHAAGTPESDVLKSPSVHAQETSSSSCSARQQLVTQPYKNAADSAESATASSLTTPSFSSNNHNNISSIKSQRSISEGSLCNSFDAPTEVVGVEKKELKRAANRRSAQLSRKRKKHFVEELKEENDDLRRKEQILRSVPDLIVTFDSAGRLGFVSHSVSNFLDFKHLELEGTSFWNRLCDESVRLMKAAFMDALANRTPDMETAPLGDGLWELRLKDKDGTLKTVTLNGLVHFCGEKPECVCSIRPKMFTPEANTNATEKKALSVASSSVQAGNETFQIKPQQSVIAGPRLESSQSNNAVRLRGQSRIAPISDGESISESGSDRI